VSLRPTANQAMTKGLQGLCWREFNPVKVRSGDKIRFSWCFMMAQQSDGELQGSIFWETVAARLASWKRISELQQAADTSKAALSSQYSGVISSVGCQRAEILA
jgi:hypothetical protein